MMETIRMQQTIQKKGELTIRNLPVEAGQQVEVLLSFTAPEKSKRPRLTANKLLNSDLIGLWQDRKDIKDSASFARQLREEAQQRYDVGNVLDDNSGQ